MDGGSARRKAAIDAQDNTNTEKTHYLSAGAGEDGSCHRPRGHCGRQQWEYLRIMSPLMEAKLFFYYTILLVIMKLIHSFKIKRYNLYIINDTHIYA
jgi:hypothetical protein